MKWYVNHATGLDMQAIQARPETSPETLYGGVTLPGKPDLENVRKLDLLPIPSIRRMQRVGIAIDRPYLQELGVQLGYEMEGLEKEIQSHIPPEALYRFCGQAAQVEELEGESDFNANSADQIRTLLFDLLKIGRGRKLKITDTGKISTGKKQLELVRGEHPVVAKILAYRERSKLKSAFTENLLERAKLHPVGTCCPVCEMEHRYSTWRVHGEVMTTRTETGRLSMKSPNLQQIPIRTELGARLRAAFIASPGTRLVSCDFAQIELRDLAHLAQCKSMIEVYEADGDIHDQTAMECFGVASRDKLDKVSHRIPSKTANFLISYGGGPDTLYGALLVAYSVLIAEGKLDKMPEWFTLEWCQQFIDRWYQARPEVKEYMELQAYRARRYGMVWDTFGRVRRVPEVRSCHSWIRAGGLRQAGNMPIQSASAGQTKLVMGEVEGEMGWMTDCNPLISVHDQMIYEVAEDSAPWFGELVRGYFENVMRGRWRVPIKADVEISERWKKAV